MYLWKQVTINSLARHREQALICSIRISPFSLPLFLREMKLGGKSRCSKSSKLVSSLLFISIPICFSRFSSPRLNRG